MLLRLSPNPDMPEPRTVHPVDRGTASPTLILLLLLLGAGALLALVAGIDKSIEALFYDPQHGFAARSDPLVMALRRCTRLAAFGVGLFLLFALLWRVVLGRALWGLSRADVVYLLAVFLLGLGPLELAHAMRLKVVGAPDARGLLGA